MVDMARHEWTRGAVKSPRDDVTRQNVIDDTSCAAGDFSSAGRYSGEPRRSAIPGPLSGAMLWFTPS